MPKLRPLFIPVFFFLALWNSGRSQTVVKFQSQIQSFPRNLSEFIAQDPPGHDIVAGRYYRYLQFAQMPTLEMRQDLQAKGLAFLAYIPHQTFLLAIPANFDRRFFQTLGVHAVVRPSAATKLASNLQQGKYPVWALSGNQIEVQFLYDPALSSQQVLQEMRGLHFDLLSAPENENLLRLRLPIMELYQLANMPSVIYVEAIPEPGQPEDWEARALHRSNLLFPPHGNGRRYDGSGIKVLVRDDGGVGPHIDFQGRLEQALIGGPGGGNHGDAVAGVFAGAGNLDPTKEGTAPGSMLYVLNYDPDFTDNTLSLHLNEGVRITNTSFSNGCNAGYTSATERVDKQIYDYPTLLHVFSAGNAGTSDCGYGAGSNWGNITGGHKMGKNVLTTANLYVDGQLATNSSRGPASDGRIKPDIAAYGQGQKSTSPNQSYITFGGTSSASPTGAGIVAQLYQAYRELNGGAFPESPLIKACILNTALDLGHPGPDFKFGWGSYHALRAVELLEENRYLQASISHGDTNSHTISVPAGVAELRVMVYWLDKAGSPLAAEALVNNLDLELNDPSGGNHLPLVLDPSPNPLSLDQAASPGIDSLNNVEQVRISSPVAGNYQVKIKGTSVAFGPQQYYVLYEYIRDEITLTHPAGGEGFLPQDSIFIHWEAWGTSAAFTLEYSDDLGISWNLISDTVPGNRRLWAWELPPTATGEGLIRVSRSGQSGQNLYPFTIVGTPQNIQIGQVCPDSIQLSWDSVPSATIYDVFVLGDKYMDSVASTTQTQISLYGLNPLQENWFAVRARGANGIKGRRSLAVQQNAGLVGCNVATDVSIRSITTPEVEKIQLCLEDSISVGVRLRNDGLSVLDSIPFTFQLDTEPPVTEIFLGNLAPGDSAIFNFANAADLSTLNGATSFHSLVIWQGLSADDNQWNDTVSKSLEILDDLLIPVFYEDFETFPVCGTAANCGDEVCDLGQGWLNAANGLEDNIDWRTDAGGTPSSGTGPVTDHAPGTVHGKYLYLEASGGCTSQEAYLLSPCIDLTNIAGPLLSFWAHMQGSSMGSIHVDIFDGTAWQLDVMTPLIGDQGPDWLEVNVDLSSYAGLLIQLRIRGITGGGIHSDLAIDDIRFFDLALPPTVDFTADLTYVCTDDTVQLEEISSPGVNQWNWTISPGTYSFVNGTDSSSTQPQVVFHAPGLYDLSLNVATPLSATTQNKTAYILVDDAGLPIPLVEDFEGPQFPPPNWQVQNPDQQNGFERISVIGSDGQPTQAVYMDNYSYFTLGGDRDFLQLPNLDFFAMQNPWLSFDLAYAPLAANFPDSLLVELSTDCGTTFPHLLYAKTGQNLGTVGSSNLSWSPADAGDWRRDSISLAPFSGQSVVIRFVNITGYGNNLFLDNIHIDGAVPVSPPTASFAGSSLQVCQDVAMTLSDSSLGDYLQYNWDFGAGASLAFANTSGPHQVSWSSPGLKTVRLTVSNAAGVDSFSQQIQVLDLPQAGFGYVNNNGFQVSFTNTSAHASSFLWLFGDGDSSSFVAPNHTFEANGTYTVRLIAMGNCESDTFQQTLQISGITPPQALIGASDTLACEDSLLVFSNFSTGVGIDSFYWDFGPNANPAFATTVGPHAVSFDSFGNQNIQLLVANAEGSSTYTISIQVTPKPNPDFGFSQVSPGLIQFQNFSVDAQSYHWDFGDGTQSNLGEPQHQFSTNGSFSVQLIASGECGQDSLTQVVQVTGLTAPTADFTLSGAVVCEAETLLVSDQSQGLNIDQYQWDFGLDAVPATASTQGPHVVKYLSPGQKMIVQQVGNSVGIAADTQYVMVEPLPQADFQAQWQTGGSWLFLNESQYGTAYSWDFGDGDSSLQVSPTHAYTANGTYLVRMIVDNACGEDTLVREILVTKVSLEGEFHDLKVELYPNPAREQLVVTFEGEQASQLRLSLWDTRGRPILYEEHLHQGFQSEKRLAVGKAARGVYILKIARSDQAIYQRVMLH